MAFVFLLSLVFTVCGAFLLFLFGGSALSAFARRLCRILFGPITGFLFGFGARADRLLVQDGVNQFLFFELVGSGDIQLLGNVPEFSNLSAVQINDVVHVGFPRFVGKVTFRISQRETRRSCTREAHGKFTTSFAVRKVLSLLTQLHDLWVAQLPGFQLKTQQCADFVESLASCSAGVEVNSAPRFVLLDQQEVGMSTYKDVRPVLDNPARMPLACRPGLPPMWVIQMRHPSRSKC